MKYEDFHLAPTHLSVVAVMITGFSEEDCLVHV